MPSATLFPAFDAIDLALTSQTKNAKGTNGQPFALNVANSLWAAKSLPLNAPFLTTLSTDFGSGVRLTDFAGDPEGSRAAINAWVSDDTNAKIPTLLPEGSITSDTVLALVDAIYFDAAWGTPFDKTLTAPGSFTTNSGTTQASMMHMAGEFSYAEVNQVQAIDLPYSGGTTDMLILLPNAVPSVEAGFDAGLTTATYNAINAALMISQVDLSLPKFTFDNGTISLKDQLTTLGMGSAFGASADFSGMSTQHVQLSDVYHQAFISVDENGTEAAAATAAVGVGTAAPAGEPKMMSVDHPFTFIIRDTASGTILFVGKVASPST